MRWARTLTRSCLARRFLVLPQDLLQRSTLLRHASLSTSNSPVGQRRPIRVCVVGSGPAGFYVTKYLIKEEEKLRRDIAVDIIDRLPTPFGLVRFGVAPDHPEVKAVQNDFEQVALDPRVRFFGNISFGPDVSVTQLSELYDVVVLAYGAAGDRELTVPGAQLKGVFAARAFVSWYNGHPDFAHMTEEFRAAIGSSDTVAVIGVGNVALDCARILIKGANALRDTDICDHALDVLSSAGAGLRRVVVLGRRGHVQASFTIKELRELTKLQGPVCLVRKDELDIGLTDASLEELKVKRPKNRIHTLLAKVAEESCGVPKDAKAVELRFLAGLSEIISSEGAPTKVGAIRVERNRLELDETTGIEHAVGSGNKDETVDCGMILGSIGYRCLPVEGVPYDDQKSIIANKGGRVQEMPGVYCSGWARRGPSGIIGTNITDARSVVAAVVEDVREGKLASTADVEGRRGLLKFLRAGKKNSAGLGEVGSPEKADTSRVQIVDWDGYQKINRDEVARGAMKGKPREKFVGVEQMLDIASTGRDASS